MKNINAILVSLVSLFLLALVGCGSSQRMNARTGAYAGAPSFQNYGAPVVVHGPRPGPRHVVAGPTGNVAALYSPIAGCEAPFRVDVENRTDKFLSVMVDGTPLPINGAAPMPMIPPNATLHICLAQPGEHKMQGIAYANRLGALTEVSRFQKRIVGKSRRYGTPYMDYKLTESDISQMEN